MGSSDCLPYNTTKIYRISMLEKPKKKKTIHELSINTPSFSESLLRRCFNKVGVDPETNELKGKFLLDKYLLNKSIKLKKRANKRLSPSESS